MTMRMLIDARHREETRVAVVRGNRIEEFDFESAERKQLKGNIYLAKVTRVEPPLQAAFIDYGGNRHGFLAFSEVHPDYYRIPVSDRSQAERSHVDSVQDGREASEYDAPADFGTTLPDIESPETLGEEAANSLARDEAQGHGEHGYETHESRAY